MNASECSYRDYFNFFDCKVFLRKKLTAVKKYVSHLAIKFISRNDLIFKDLLIMNCSDIHITNLSREWDCDERQFKLSILKLCAND